MKLTTAAIAHLFFSVYFLCQAFNHVGATNIDVNFNRLRDLRSKTDVKKVKRMKSEDRSKLKLSKTNSKEIDKDSRNNDTGMSMKLIKTGKSSKSPDSQVKSGKSKGSKSRKSNTASPSSSASPSTSAFPTGLTESSGQVSPFGVESSKNSKSSKSSASQVKSGKSKGSKSSKSNTASPSSSASPSTSASPSQNCNENPTRSSKSSSKSSKSSKVQDSSKSSKSSKDQDSSKTPKSSKSERRDSLCENDEDIIDDVVITEDEVITRPANCVNVSVSTSQVYNLPFVLPSGVLTFDDFGIVGQMAPFADTPQFYEDAQNRTGDAAEVSGETCQTVDMDFNYFCKGTVKGLNKCNGQLSFQGTQDPNGEGIYTIVGGTQDFLGATGSVYAEYDGFDGTEYRRWVIN